MVDSDGNVYFSHPSSIQRKSTRSLWMNIYEEELLLIFLQWILYKKKMFGLVSET